MVNTKGELVITCSEERSQNKNRDIVLRKIQEKVDQASVAPKERKLRREVSDEVKKRWVEEKRKHSEKKQWRKGKGSQIEHFSGVFGKYVNIKLDAGNLPNGLILWKRDGKSIWKKNIRAAGIEPATLRLLRCSHYSLTLYQLS